MLAEQYRDFMEATTGAACWHPNISKDLTNRLPCVKTQAELPPISSSTARNAELRRSTAATAAKVMELRALDSEPMWPSCQACFLFCRRRSAATPKNCASRSERRSAMLAALAGLNDQPYQAFEEQEMPSAAMEPAAALQMCSAAALMAAMPRPVRPPARTLGRSAWSWCKSQPELLARQGDLHLFDICKLVFACGCFAL